MGQGPAGKFGPVIHPQDLRHAVGQGELFEDVDEVLSGDRDIDGVVEDYPGVFVDDGGDLESGAVFEVVGLEVDRPHVMRIQRRGGCIAGGGPAAFTPPPLGHAQALFAP